MRDGGLGNREVPAEPLAGTLVVAGDGFEQGDPPGIGERLGDGGELIRAESGAGGTA